MKNGVTFFVKADVSDNLENTPRISGFLLSNERIESHPFGILRGPAKIPPRQGPIAGEGCIAF